MALNISTKDGWNPWYFVKTLNGKNAVVSEEIDQDYVPSSGFWTQAYANHCEFPSPWTTGVSQTGDTFGQFMAGGGGSGTLMGSMAGLANIASDRPNPPATFGIGGKSAVPRIGYCLGEEYKEQVYFWIGIFKSEGLVIGDGRMDVLHRSRFNRFYINHGNILRYAIESGEHVITIDVNGTKPNVVFPAISLKIIKQTGEEFTVNVLRVLDNYQLVIEPPSGLVPSSGDFYVCNSVICIKDPFLLSGVWAGLENDKLLVDVPSSGKNLHITSNNRFYDELVFTGVYVRSNIETGEIITAAAGSSMLDSEIEKWKWIKSSNFDKSNVYKDDPDRYVIERTESYIEDVFNQGEQILVANRNLVKRVNGKKEDIDAWMKSGANYVRIEISKGGDTSRTNWHAPILERGWLKQNGKYFKIIGQPDCNIIDISLKDVSGKVDFDINGSGSIFNHFGWFISEHFMQDSNKQESGIFGGPVTITGKTISINTYGESNGTIKPFFNESNLIPLSKFKPEYLGGINSFYNRFVKDTCPNGGTVKAWLKYDGWKVSTYDGSYYDIESITFSKYPTDPWTRYTISCVLSGATEDDIKKKLDGKEVWVTFSQPYKRKLRLTMGSFDGTFSEGRTSTLCANMVWTSIPMDVPLPGNTVIGFCDGALWGVGANRTAVVGNMGFPMIITTPSSKMVGLSAIYDTVKQEHLIYYNDVYTNKLTIRGGSLDFLDFPRKIEVSFGKFSAIETASEFPVSLNTKYDRCKMLTMTMPQSEIPGAACTFQIGTEEDYHGFLINGGGVVDFQPLRRSGLKADVETFKYKDYYCSPCFEYMPSTDISLSDGKILFIGANTEDGPIYVKNGKPTNITVCYVNDNQTLSSIGGVSAFNMQDGENILLYSSKVASFTTATSKKKIDTTEWDIQNGVFAIGSTYDLTMWGCPTVKNLTFNGDDKYQCPILLMPNADFQTAIYNQFNKTICLFSICVKDDVKYLCAYTISVLKFTYKLELCTSNEKELLTSNENPPNNFLWRPPAVEDLWMDSKHIPEIVLDKAGFSDLFVRVMGKKSTESQIESDLDDWGIINTYVLMDGTYIVLYDDIEGVKMIYSTTGGISWRKSDIMLAKDSKCGLMLDDSMFLYITPEGIKMKVISYKLIREVMSTEGSTSDFKEQIQYEFDNCQEFLIGSGKIGFQRLAGYQDPRGVYRVFYYDENGLLSCLKSSSFLQWEMSPNF